MKGFGTLILTLVVGLIIAAGVALTFKEKDEEAGRGYGGGTPGVEVAVIQSDDFTSVIEALGTARANESLTVMARVSETVQRVNFDDGDNVVAGDVLVELTREEESAELSAARAALEEAQKQYDRIADLVNRGNASKSTLDERVLGVQEARSRVQTSQARIDDRIIRAPFAGTLGLRMVSEGTLVAPGTEITTLDDISVIKLDFSVPEAFYALLEEGLEVRARTAALGNEVFAGRVVTVNSRIDPITRAVTVRAIIPNDSRRLRPGMLMTVSLISEARQGLAVPENALVPVGNQQFVYVVDDENRVERREVFLGIRRQNMVEVSRGLRAGERVVVKGTMQLRPGMDVRVINEDALSQAQTQGRGR